MLRPECLPPDSGSPAPDNDVPPPGQPAPLVALVRIGHSRFSRIALREWTVAEGTAVFMLSFLISAMFGIVRQMLLNAHFGISPEASAYYAAFRLPETIALLLTGGTLANAMLPVLLTVAHSEGEQAARRFIDLILTTLLVIIAPAVVVGLVVTPWFVTHLLAPGFDAATSQLTTTLTRIMLLELVLLVVVSVVTAVLMSRNQFFLPAIGVAVHNFTVIGGTLAAMVVPGVGVYGPTAGVVLDGLLQLGILLPGLLMQGIRYRPVWDLGNRHLHAVFRLLVPSGLSGAVNYAGGIVDMRFASLAHEAGSIPALHNSLLLFGVPVRLLGIAVGQAVFPRLAAYVVAREWRRLTTSLVRALGVALALALLVTGGLLGLGRLIIRILFEHGQFDGAAGSLTYTVLVAYAAALPAAVATEILTRTLLALSDTRTPLLINGCQLAGRIALIPALLPVLGVVAIPVAFAVTATLETIALAVVVLTRVRARRMENGE